MKLEKLNLQETDEDLYESFFEISVDNFKTSHLTKIEQKIEETEMNKLTD